MTVKRPQRAGARPARAVSRSRRPQARRPKGPIRRRALRRLPSIGRLSAAFLVAALVAALVALINGPWLRVGDVAWAGEHFTPAEELAAALEPLRGQSLLTLDSAALEARLEVLPAVADARVEARLPHTVAVTVAERLPAFLWQTSASRLVGSDDARIIAALPRDAELPAELAALPFVDDARPTSRLMAVGDVIPAELVATALRLVTIDPAALGSTSTRFDVRIEDEYGFVLVSAEPAWRAAFGFYRLDLEQTAETAAERIERQIGAVRTLFVSEAEGTVSWVDARNPGKVYFRAGG